MVWEESMVLALSVLQELRHLLMVQAALLVVPIKYLLMETVLANLALL